MMANMHVSGNTPVANTIHFQYYTYRFICFYYISELFVLLIFWNRVKTAHTATENLLSKRVRFGARVITR